MALYFILRCYKLCVGNPRPLNPPVERRNPSINATTDPAPERSGKPIAFKYKTLLLEIIAQVRHLPRLDILSNQLKAEQASINK